jgi:addiction module HigA family antidote
MKKKKIPPVHPGEILDGEFLRPLGISQYQAAKAMGVSPRRINEIVRGKRGISADTALRLGKYFGVEPQFWLNMQNRYDLDLESDRLEDILTNKIPTLRLAG